MIHLWVSLEVISTLSSIKVIYLVVDFDHLLNELAEYVWYIYSDKLFLDFWLQTIFEQ